MHHLIKSGKVDGKHFEDIMVQLWKFILGDDCFAEGKPGIQCSMHAIPKQQSADILLWMMEAAGPMGAPSVGMSYINISPSSYEG